MDGVRTGVCVCGRAILVSPPSEFMACMTAKATPVTNNEGACVNYKRRLISKREG